MSCKLVLVIATAVLLQLSVAEVEFPGQLVNSPYSIASFMYTFPQVCDATGIYTVCQSCKSALVCIQGSSEILNCPADKPFCNKNACSTTLSSEYECLPDPLKCTGIGFYPDPKQCQFYHYCEATAEDSSVYDCQPGNVFNPATSLCKVKRLASDCMTVTCDPSKVLQYYGTSKTYFAYCSATDIKMLKCDTNYVFIGTGCQFQCPKEGNFPHPDPAKYNMCYLSNFKLVSKEVDCPTGKEFNTEKQVCLTPTQ